MSALLRLGCLLLLLGVQAAVTPHLAIAGVRPDLPLVAVLLIALFGGPARGGAAGLVVGLSLDLLRGTRLGLFGLAAGAAGWLCGEAGGRVDPTRASVRWFLAAASALAYGVIVAGVAAVLDRSGIHATGAARHVVIAALYDGTLATLAYAALAARYNNPLPMGPRPPVGWRNPLGSRRRRR
jgi:rod shape-determining protein MreD